MSITAFPVDVSSAEGVVLNINKPAGITSFGVVRKVKRWSGFKKVGHAGTLDPAATGVLIVLCGKATKKSAEFMEQTKEYDAVIELGRCSTTDDAEGDIISTCPVPDFSIDNISTVVRNYIGEIQQVPPMFSALRKDGKRLYKLARKGITVERDPRPVMIYNIEINKWESPILELTVTCGRGTYIRALARDIGNELKVGGLLTSLVRTRIGECQIEDAWDLDSLESALNDKK